jgi:transposase
VVTNNRPVRTGSLPGVGSFVRRVTTASGAIAVQIVHKRGRTVLGIDHVGSARDQAQLALLLEVADARLHAGQQLLPLDEQPTSGGRPVVKPVVEGTASLVVWEALEAVYAALGFDQLGDRAFKALVLARIIEPTSKADTVRVMAELGVPGPTRVTFMRCLKRVIERDYRGVIATACYAHAARGGGLALVLYDLTTLHFETDVEDRLRKVGMSKDRRVDPQVTVGLLTTASGFPLQVHLFEGNKGETTTLIPVLTAFAARHQVADMVVVADAGMLSAANLLALENAGFGFIVGSKTTSAAADLADHFKRHGNAFTDGQVIETTRTMGTGKDARDRRVVYQYLFKRSQHDRRAINKMIERAEAVAAGTRPLKKDRFVQLSNATKGVDWALVERARYLSGLKGYLTNLDPETMDGPAVVAAYHELYQVERSFRMAKSDLAARPMFHRIRDSIEAHMTVVFAALAVSREAQDRTGVSIKKTIQTLRPLRSATISLGHRQITAPPRIPDTAQAILDDLTRGGH